MAWAGNSKSLSEYVLLLFSFPACAILSAHDVKAWSERKLVEQAAWSVPGVKTVEDRLRVA